MRWDYPDPSDVAEAKQRDAVTAAMDRWWQVFVANKDNLDAAFSAPRTGGGASANFDIAQFTSTNLNPITEGLCWEYGRAMRKDGHRLVITPEGDHHLAPLVRELLRRAPELPDWEFYPGRLPEPPEMAFAVAEQIARFKAAADVKVRASLGKFRRVDLQFHIANAKGNEQSAQHWMFRAVEQMLGEDILNHWLGVIELAPPQPLVKRLFGGRPAGVVAPERLKPTVDALIAASREQLPDPPPRVIAQRDANDARLSWYTIKGEPDAGLADYPQRDDIFVLATCEVELAEAQANDPLFHSPRFSRSGETFAYLKLDRSADAHGSAPIDSADARGAIEDAVNATLAEHGLGCTTGGGTGVMYAYVDVALTDVSRAILILRQLLQRHRVNQRSWLLFFEPELADEWVGIYPQTPPPPARAKEEDDQT